MPWGRPLDGQTATDRIHHCLPSTGLARTDFCVRNGMVVDEVPEPGTLALFAASGSSSSIAADVLPSVSYLSVRRWQRRGAKPCSAASQSV